MNRLRIVSRFLASILLSALFIMLGSPLIHQAYADEHDTEALARGRELFEVSAGGVGCATCHGHFGLGDLGIGPNIRGADASDIKKALQSNPDMEFLSLSNAEIDDLSTFMVWLGTSKPAKVVVTDGQLSETEITVSSASYVQIIIDNKDRQDYEVLSEALGSYLIPARTVTDLLWEVSAESSVELELLDDMGPSGSIIINVEAEE